MKNQENRLTEFERYLLKVVAEGKGEAKWSWHDIAILVVYTGREGEGHMMETLKRLEQKGLVKSYVQTGNPVDHWEITEVGEHMLKGEQ
jgi:DNA-binding PadR family transcriptional regulator